MSASYFHMLMVSLWVTILINIYGSVGVHLRLQFVADMTLGNVQLIIQSRKVKKKESLFVFSFSGVIQPEVL